MRVSNAPRFFLRPLKYSGHLRDVRTLCLFAGQGRSGSTLVCALMNAHPKLTVANEYGLLDRLLHLRGPAKAWRRRCLYAECMAKTRRQNSPADGASGLAMAGGYNYFVPGQHQAKLGGATVLGDKHPGTNALLLQKFGAERVARVLRDWPAVFVRVLRNPYDVLTSKRLAGQKTLATVNAKRRALLEGAHKSGALSALWARAEVDPMAFAIGSYFHAAEGMEQLAKCGRWPVLDVHYRDLCAEPRRELARILGFLGLDADEEYLRACAEVVGECSRARNKRAEIWDAETRELVAGQMRRFDFLAPYDWDSP